MGFFGTTTTPAANQAGLTLILGDKQVTSGWWEAVGDEIELRQTSQLHSFGSHDEGLVEVDAALQELNQVSESVNQVIFGVEPSWMVGKGELAEEPKAWLKKISDSLNLEPVGFVVTAEAYVQHFIQTQPQANVIILYVLAEQALITVLRLGKVQVQELVGRSGNLAADVVEALARHETAESIWPAKVAIASASLGQSDLATAAHEFIHFQWSDATPWSAAPLTEVIDHSALVMAVSTEAGRAAVGLPPKTKSTSTASPTQAKSFGIPMAVEPTNADTSDNLASSVTDEATDDQAATEPRRQPLAKLSQLVVGHKPFIIGGVVLGILTVLGIGWAFLQFTARATVVLTPQTTRVTAAVPVEFSTTAATAQTTPSIVLPAKTASAEVDLSKQTPATGVKLVGEKAKGEVTMLNKTTAAKTFAAGTIVSLGSTQFTLDNEVTVASASVETSGDTETKKFGKANVAVTASKIGSEGNIGAGSTLTVASFDQNTYAASNDKAFAGGTSREARAVAEEDLQLLLSEARQEALSKAEDLLGASLSPGQYALPTGQLKVLKAEYSNKVGDEVDTVGLTYQAQISGVVYEATTLREAVQAALRAQVPSTNEIVSDKIELLTTPNQDASPSARLQLIVNASAPSRPKVDTAQLAEQLAGKPMANLSALLQSSLPVSKFDVRFEPPLAGRILKNLPGAKRLTITIE